MKDRVNKKHTTKFTTTSNKILQDGRLTYEAIGIFMYLWSMPDDWQIIVRQVMKHNNSTEYKVRQALSELRNYGYMKWKRLQCYCEYDMCEDGSYHCGDIQHDDTQHDDTQHDDIYIQSNNINKTITNINTASGLSQNENPTVKDFLQVQKPKKEDDFEKFKQFWILYERPKKEVEWKKPNIARKKAYSLFQQRLKEMSFDELIENTVNYFKFKEIEKSETAPMDILPFLNGKCQVDYKSKVDAICKSTGKLAPLPQKTTMEAEKEVIDTNALIELRNAKYNALTQDRQKASDEIRDFLLTYFGELHREWINSSLWHQQTLVNNEVDLHIGIFLQDKRKVIELNAEKIRNKFPLLKGNTVNQIIIKVIK
jgi:hypothetical protein